MSQEIEDYIVLDSEYSSKLSKKVIGYINIGWVPLGPAQVSITKADYSVDKIFSQTLVKYKKVKEIKPSLSYIKD